MKKGSIFSVLIVIVLFTVSLTGCIFDDEDKKVDYPYAESSGLNLTLDVDAVSLLDDINITIRLINVNKTPVKVFKHFTLDIGLLDVYLTGPNNETLHIFYGESNFPDGYIILKQNDYLSIIINLKNELIQYPFLGENESYGLKRWNWTTPGKFSVYAKYGYVKPEIYSSIVEFEVD